MFWGEHISSPLQCHRICFTWLIGAGRCVCPCLVLVMLLLYPREVCRTPALLGAVVELREQELHVAVKAVA